MASQLGCATLGEGKRAVVVAMVLLLCMMHAFNTHKASTVFAVQPVDCSLVALGDACFQVRSQTPSRQCSHDASGNPIANAKRQSDVAGVTHAGCQSEAASGRDGGQPALHQLGYISSKQQHPVRRLSASESHHVQGRSYVAPSDATAASKGLHCGSKFGCVAVTAGLQACCSCRWCRCCWCCRVRRGGLLLRWCSRRSHRALPWSGKKGCENLCGAVAQLQAHDSQAPGVVGPGWRTLPSLQWAARLKTRGLSTLQVAAQLLVAPWCCP